MFIRKESMAILLICALLGLVSDVHADSAIKTLVLEQRTATGASTTYNAISVNGLFLGLHTSSPVNLEGVFEDHDDEAEEDHAHVLPAEGGLSVQEVEIRMTSNVDAYLRGDLIIAIPGSEGLELEEGYVESIGLPNVTLRIGKFFSTIGKHNGMHTHAFPFIDAPIAQQRLLGGEGLNEVGLRASFLVPARWFVELNLEVLDGVNELFDAQRSGDFVYVLGIRNLWDLSDDSTLEIGAGGAAGHNKTGDRSSVIGTNLTWKWQPNNRSRQSLVLQAEYLWAQRKARQITDEAGGLYTSLQLQASRMWWVQGRYDGFGFPGNSAPRQHRFTGLLAFAASEFSALRIQYSLGNETGEKSHQIAVQLNFTMGAHPAHAY
jgi:hypothetical protein